MFCLAVDVLLCVLICQGHNIDQMLTSKQSADTLAFTALLTEKLLPAIVRQLHCFYFHFISRLRQGRL